MVDRSRRSKPASPLRAPARGPAAVPEAAAKGGVMRGKHRSVARLGAVALPLAAAVSFAIGLGVASGSGARLSCGLDNGQKAHGKAINVGAVVTASGGLDFSSAAKGAAAFFACVNDNGGIHGR